MQNIDYVVPYSNNSKDKIKELMKNYNYIGMDDSDNELSKRYNSEEKIFQLQVRSIAKNMPWINTFHLIVENDNHIPTWLNTEMVHIVYQKDFMLDYPSYNSTSIECFLHKIPNLSEYFIYGNSDYIITKPLNENNFFAGEKTKHKFDRFIFNKNAQYNCIAINSYRLIYGDNSNPIIPSPHALTPIVKERAKKVYEQYENKLLSSVTKFRSIINYNQYIYPLYDKLLGMTETSNLLNYTTEGYYNEKALQKADVVCLANIDDDHPLINKFENIYKFEKCKYEK